MKLIFKKYIYRFINYLFKEDCLSLKMNSNLSAHSYYSFWQHVYQHSDLWENCDILLTCQMTYSAALTQFPNKNIVLLSDATQLTSFYLNNSNKFQYLGIFSPELCLALLQNNSLLTRIMQLCKFALIITIPVDPEMSIHRRLLTLHTVGFQQVHSIESKNKKLISLNIFPRGDYLYSSNSPGLPTNEWISQVCYRMIHFPMNTYPWSISYGYIIQNENNQLKTFSQQTAIGIIHLPHDADESKLSTKIEAEFCWTSQSKFQAGNASLVSCYSGPADTNMYALVINLLPEFNIGVHLYKITTEWALLEHVVLSSKELMTLSNTLNTSDLKKVKLWLKVTKDQVIVGSNDRVLLEINDASLPRNNYFGIRLFSDDLTMSIPRISSC